MFCLPSSWKVHWARHHGNPPGTERQLRTHDSITNAAAEAEEKGTVVDGIKGKSALSPIIDLTLGTPIDYMYCSLEVVVKRLLDKWVSSPGMPFYLNKHKLQNIDSNLVHHIFPELHAPKSEHRNYW